MAVIKNTYEKDINSNEVLGKYTITGLTSETSTTQCKYYVSKEISLHFLRDLYQTLLDAGYEDTIMNESEYSITVLGFKFFCLCSTIYNSYTYLPYGITPLVYTYGFGDAINQNGNYWNSTSGKDNVSISNTNTTALLDVKLRYNIIVRGNKDGVGIWYSSYPYPNSEVSLIFINKATNIYTLEDAYFYCGELGSYDSIYEANKWRFRNVSDLYTEYVMNTYGNSYSTNPLPYYSTTYGLMTMNKCALEPVLGWSGSFILKSVYKGNLNFHERGKYYKIGTDIYFCYTYKYANYGYNTGSVPVLFKVSD